MVFSTNKLWAKYFFIGCVNQAGVGGAVGSKHGGCTQVGKVTFLIVAPERPGVVSIMTMQGDGVGEGLVWGAGGEGRGWWERGGVKG